MKKFGSWSEQESSRFKTSGDNKEVSLVVPSTLTGASNEFTTPNISGTNDNLLSRTSSDTGSNRLQNKELSTDNVLFVNQADTTKKVQFDLSGLSTSTTHTISFPNTSGTLVYTSNTTALTNKGINADNNSISNIDNDEIKAAAGIELSKLAATTASRALVSDGSGFISASAVTSTELAQLSGVSVGGNTSGDILTTDDTQTVTNKSIDSDNNTITNIVNADIKAAAAIALNKLAATTASRALVSDASGFVSPSIVTSTELGYVAGATSALQTQIDGKQADVITTRGDVIVGNASGDAIRLAVGAVGTVLTSDGTDAAWASPAGTGDVTAAANIADNALVRGDGGAKGIQQSGITVSDADFMSGIGELESEFVVLKKATVVDHTIASGEVSMHPLLTVSTGDTVTVDSGGDLFSIDTVTVDGTLTINGNATVLH